MKERKKVCINILNYNTYEKSKKCIESCLQQKGLNFSILLIDNCSTDDSLQKLKNEFGNSIFYLKNKENYGYAGGNNLGVSYCNKKGYDYSFLLNSDIVLNSPLLLKHLVDVLENDDKCAIVAPMIYNVTSKGLELNCNDSQYLRMLRKVRILPKLENLSENLTTISEAHGSALLVKNNIFLEVGGFPEYYFMYGEESTFSKKIIWSGHKIIWYKISDMNVLHYHDKTGKVDSWRLYLMGRNRTIEYYENCNRAPLRWFCVFYCFLFIQFLKRNTYFLNGVKAAKVMHYKHSTYKDYYIDGKDSIRRIK